MAIKNGYMRTRRPDGSFDTFLPITTTENIVAGDNLTLEERLIQMAQNANEIDQALIDFIQYSKDSLEALEKSDKTFQHTLLRSAPTRIDAEQESVAAVQLRGKTVINLVPNGGFEYILGYPGWTVVGGSASLYTTAYSTLGDSGGVRSVMLSSFSGNTLFYADIMNLSPEKKYIAVADIMTSGYTSGQPAFAVSDTDNSNAISQDIDISAGGRSKWASYFVKFTGRSDARIRFGQMVSPSVYYLMLDNVGLYEVSDEVYQQIGTTITATNVREHFPHVDGKQSVVNPSIQKSNKNLAIGALSPQTRTLFASPYDAQVSPNGLASIPISVVAGETYTASLKTSGLGFWNIANEKGVSSPTFQSYVSERSTTTPVTFTVPANVTTIYLNMFVKPDAVQPATFYEWQVEHGGVATDFVANNSERMTPITTLASIGDVADTLEILGNEAVLNQRIARMISLSATAFMTVTKKTGYAIIGFRKPTNMADSKGFRVQTYRNDLYATLKDAEFSNDPTTSGGAAFYDPSSGYIYVSVSDSVTGWKDGITPEMYAVKGFLNGWKATGDNGTRYTAWVSQIDSGVTPTPASGSNYFVDSTKPTGWGESFLYVDHVLDTPTRSNIIVDGSLSVEPGLNHFTLSEAMIMFESVTPSAVSGMSLAMGINQSTNPAKKRIKRITGIYRNGNLDTNWVIGPVVSTVMRRTSGFEMATISKDLYDPTAQYTFSYEGFDLSSVSVKSPDVELMYRGGITGLLGSAVRNIIRLQKDNDRQDTWLSSISNTTNTASNAASTAQTEVNLLKERLDQKPVYGLTLPYGNNVVVPPRQTGGRFRLTTLKGRSLMNLLGSDGSTEYAARWIPGLTTLSFPVSPVPTGSKSAMRVTLTGATGNAVNKSLNTLQSSKYYLLAAEVMNVDAEYVNIGISMYEASTNTVSVAPSTEYKFVYSLFTGVTTTSPRPINVSVSGAAGQSALVSKIRLYELSSAEYSAMRNATADVISKAYPYVDGIQGISGISAITTAANIIPPFYDHRWKLSRNDITTFIEDANSILVTFPYEEAYLYTDVLVTPNTQYRFMTSASIIGRYKFSAILPNGTEVPITVWTPTQYVNGFTITTPATISKLRVYVGNDGDESPDNVYRFANISLYQLVGAAIPKYDQNNPKLLVDTTLHSYPIGSSTVSDLLFEREGTLYKMRSWNDVALNGQMDWTFIQSFTGYKIIGFKGLPMSGDSYGLGVNVFKYNGQLLTKSGTMSAGDNAYFRAAELGYFNMSVSMDDSGWPDNYTPTKEEIAAYIMGWKMYSPSMPTSQPYNTSLTKGWVKIPYKDYGSAPPGGWEGRIASVVPTTSYNDEPGWKPYRVMYRLKRQVIEPVSYEGGLNFITGQNSVFLSSNVRMHRPFNPTYNSGSREYEFSLDLNKTNWLQSGFTLDDFERCKEIIGVYRDGVLDTRWTIVNSTVVSIPVHDYEPGRRYTISYIADRFDVPFDLQGILFDTERGQIDETLSIVMSINNRLNAIERSRQRINVPSIVLNSTLNNYGQGYQPFKVYRNQQDEICMEGVLTCSSGKIAIASTLFTLPEGSRPAYRRIAFIPFGNNSGTLAQAMIEILPDGRVINGREITLDTGGANIAWLSFENIRFPPVQ